MRHIESPQTDPAGQLALDEALLLEADQNQAGEFFRTWEFDQPVVVVGRASKVGQEVDREFCQSKAIPVLRRCSGGAAVVGGPGCLMYSIVLSLDRDPELRKIDVAHRYVMQRVLTAVSKQLPDVRFQGTCDLTWLNRKCSGNSLKIARHHLLYHGTILYQADLKLLADALGDAPRQPDYREGRGHGAFVTNIPIDPNQLSVHLAGQFGVTGQLTAALPLERVRQLRRDRYDDPNWHHRH